MKQLMITSLLLFLAVFPVCGQVSLPYQTGFDDASEQNGWVQYKKGTQSSFQEWDYVASQGFGASTALMHYYPVGGSVATDDWFVSPAFLIPTGGTLDSLRYSFSGFGLPQTADTVFVYLLFGDQDPDVANTRTILYEFSGSNYQNDETWRILSPITLPAQPAGDSYLAFRYKTVSNWLDVRFDNVAISGNSAAGIAEGKTGNSVVYPNPSNGSVMLKTTKELTSDCRFELYDLAGKLVHEGLISENMPIDLPVEPGCYQYRILSADLLETGRLVIR
ncbi:MAG TPA: choice-of-anchor J domain-containing protein [Fluviicola sp.]|nr:choice-of-anchor J domain-containing protein [Fluviicola sp.]